MHISTGQTAFDGSSCAETLNDGAAYVHVDLYSPRNKCMYVNGRLKFSFPKQRILDSPKPKEFVDDNFKSDVNDGKFSRRVENTGKLNVFKSCLLLMR